MRINEWNRKPHFPFELNQQNKQKCFSHISDKNKSQVKIMNKDRFFCLDHSYS
jgi:translation initiation factor IF-1